MKEILIATQNEYKRRQFVYLFRDFNVSLKTLRDFDCREKIEENGKTARENALLKARFWAQKTGLLTLGDDAGLYVDALNGEPGLQARRWNGFFKDDVDDETWLAYFLKRMEGVPPGKRTGRYVAAWAVATPDRRESVKDIVLEFLILEKPVRPYVTGSPMSALRFFPEYGKAEAQLTEVEQWAQLLREMRGWKELGKILK